MSRRPFDDAQNFTVNVRARVSRETDALQHLPAMISRQHRQRFVKKLFGGNGAEFDDFIAALDAIPDWCEAHQTMKEYFSERYINPYQEEAICLTDIVYKRYFPMDAYIQPQF
jgi:hypothetical protein